MRYGKSAAGLSSRSINPESSANITATVMTAFFAAVIFLGIQSVTNWKNLKVNCGNWILYYLAQHMQLT